MKSDIQVTAIVADLGTYLQRKSIRIMRRVRRVLGLTDAALWGAGKAHITFMAIVVGCWICAAVVIAADQLILRILHVVRF